MAVTKRSVITKTVAAMLESDEHETAEDMALAIIKTVQAHALDSESYSLHNRDLGFDFAWGPYATEREAKKDMAHLTGGISMVVKLLPVTKLRSRSVSDFRVNSPCTTCRHPQVAHYNGCACASNRCDCREYIK